MEKEILYEYIFVNLVKELEGECERNNEFAVDTLHTVMSKSAIFIWFIYFLIYLVLRCYKKQNTIFNFSFESSIRCLLRNSIAPKYGILQCILYFISNLFQLNVCVAPIAS